MLEFKIDISLIIYLIESNLICTELALSKTMYFFLVILTNIPSKLFNKKILKNKSSKIKLSKKSINMLKITNKYPIYYKINISHIGYLIYVR